MIKAEDVIMPFGKYKGRKLLDLTSTVELEYLRWVVSTYVAVNEMRECIKQHIIKHNKIWGNKDAGL